MNITDGYKSSGLPGLRFLREKAGMTREQLAAQAGIAFSTVCRLEAGKGDARCGSVDRLMGVLSCSYEQLTQAPAVAS